MLQRTIPLMTPRRLIALQYAAATGRCQASLTVIFDISSKISLLSIFVLAADEFQVDGGNPIDDLQCPPVFRDGSLRLPPPALGDVFLELTAGNAYLETGMRPVLFTFVALAART
jgi:hypothetical protein